MFCKTCGSLLVPNKTPYGKWLSCPAGHYQPELNQENNLSKEKSAEIKRVEVADGVNILAVYDHKCKRCGYGKAELKERLAAYSDEDNFYLMKCGSCNFIEKLEGKTR